MNFLETLNHWDTNLFLLINGVNTSFFDVFMWTVSTKLTWVPLYLSVLFVVIKYWKKDAIWIVLSLILCVVLADQIASGVIKNLVQRLRPSHAVELEGLIHLVKGYKGGMFGFVSSHAANAFGFALLSSLLFNYKPYTLVIFFWAIITAYSRIYLGVHYPFDVLGGAIVGGVSALLFFLILKRFFPTLFNENVNSDVPSVKIPVWILCLSFFGIAIYSLIIL